MNTFLNPCVIFDLDDTLFETPDINWSEPEDDWYEQIEKAIPIESNAFLYQSIDYMINDPPDWAAGNPDWPQDIFFCTARPDFFREPTLKSLSKLTKESTSFLNRRLIMRPYTNDSDLTHSTINTTKESKTWTLTQVLNKGFRPVLVFDNCPESVSVYIEGDADVVHQSFASFHDKAKAITLYAV
jgi:hypothetical protein